jgi:hypothetical protein
MSKTVGHGASLIRRTNPQLTWLNVLLQTTAWIHKNKSQLDWQP